MNLSQTPNIIITFIATTVVIVSLVVFMLRVGWLPTPSDHKTEGSETARAESATASILLIIATLICGLGAVVTARFEFSAGRQQASATAAGQQETSTAQIQTATTQIAVATPLATTPPSGASIPTSTPTGLGPPLACPPEIDAPLGKTPYDKPGPELVAAFNCKKYAGTTVVIEGPFTPDSEDGRRLQETLKYFQDRTGITIVYTGTNQFENLITQQVETGNAPDIADFSQPGLLRDLAKTGKVIDLNRIINRDWLETNYSWGNDEAKMQSPNGSIQAGIWWRLNFKSLVWYPKKAFDRAGYKVPRTWVEMQQLMNQMVADRHTPWCIGIESGAATGWPATDWIEDIMLRTTSVENYDKWTRGELPFTDPIVKNAVKIMSDIWLNKDYVYGGRGAIVGTSWNMAVAPMFDDSPKCWLHKQSSIITGFFPTDKVFGTDYDVFYLPTIDAQYGRPMLFAGDIMAMFNDRPEVRATIQYMTLGESLKVWLSKGGIFAPQGDSQEEWYGNLADRYVANIVRNATYYRFDASDQMPKPVGQGTFWRGITDYVAGSIDLDQALEAIQKGWSQTSP